MAKPMKTVLKSASEPVALEGALEGARRATGSEQACGSIKSTAWNAKTEEARQ